MQIIFILETKNKSGSDYYFVESIMSRFYKKRGMGISFKYLYMNGKSNYKFMESKITKLRKQYQFDTIVIYFFDTDSHDLNYDQKQLNKEIIKYCSSLNYEIVWFKRTIEETFLGHDISSKDKIKEAYSFFKQNKINLINKKNLDKINYHTLKPGESNVLNVLNIYIPQQ